jgi:hypothetical protein
VERYSGAMWPTVPRTAVVTCDSRWSRSFASPKSPTIASQQSSSSMFAALTSLWMILGSHCSCRYSRPRAAPSAILFLVIQSSGGFPVVWVGEKKLMFWLQGNHILCSNILPKGDEMETERKKSNSKSFVLLLSLGRFYLQLYQAVTLFGKKKSSSHV